MLAKMIGVRYSNMFQAWYKSGLIFTAGAGTAFLYLTDWRVIVDYIPIYNTKFKDEEKK